MSPSSFNLIFKSFTDTLILLEDKKICVAYCYFSFIIAVPFSNDSMIKLEFLFQEKPIYPARLVSNTCALLASVVSELEASATGVEVRKGLCKVKNNSKNPKMETHH